MATSPEPPSLAKYYYISKDRDIRSDAFTVKKDRWTIIRYNLETHNGAFVNSRSFLRGYNAQFEELHEALVVPDVFYVHRETLLPGMKAYQPVCTHPKYNSYKEQLSQLQTQLFGSYMESYGSGTRNHDAVLKKMSKLQETIKSFEAREGFHSSKLDIQYTNISKDPTVTHIAGFPVPPSGYQCKKCHGTDHFAETCSAIAAVSEEPKFGAHKMKSLSIGTEVRAHNVGRSEDSSTRGVRDKTHRGTIVSDTVL
jgi:hypothetical protein